MIDYLGVGAIVAIIVGWFGSIEFRLRSLDVRVRNNPSRREVSEEIEVRQESIKVLQREIKEDIKEIRRAIEKLSKR